VGMKLSWRHGLSRFLREAHRVAVVGVGNPIRGDDAAGTYTAELLRTLSRRNPHGCGEAHGSLLCIPAGAVPENYLWPVIRFRPSHVVVVDAFDAGLEPGAVSIIPRSSMDGLSLSSHQLPLGLVRDFLSLNGVPNQLYIGIQPASTGPGTPMSSRVKASSRKVARTIARLARQNLNR